MEEKDRFMKERLQKLNEVKAKGINPYPYSYTRSHTSSEVQEQYKDLKDQEKSEETVAVAGRIMQFRDMGKAAFCHIQDGTGRVQVYLRKDDIGEEQYFVVKKLDIGDIIGIKGKVFKTKMGETTVYAEELTLLTKGLHPLPEKYHGLKDPELRYRMRYVDLIMNPEVKKTFELRAKIIKAIRNYLDENGFMEVQTPILQTQYGGANARPFVSKINAWNLPAYLRIAYELHLKRLIVGGFEKIYDLSYCFRNEGVDKTHNPEFSMMEIQWAYADYNDMMVLTENLFEHVAKEVFGSTKIKYGEHEIELKAPWRRLTVKDAIKEYADIDVNKLSDEQLFDLRTTYNIDVEGDLNRGTMILLLFEELCEDKIIQPTHIIDHPKESCPLSKPHRDDPELVERVEPFIVGWEMGNGYSELNDPVLQHKLLKEQEEKGRGGDEEAHPMDEDFVRALEFGLPPNAGMGIGIDRMIMLLTNSESIRDVILFPTMRPENKDNNKDKKKESDSSKKEE